MRLLRGASRCTFPFFFLLYFSKATATLSAPKPFINTFHKVNGVLASSSALGGFQIRGLCPVPRKSPALRQCQLLSMPVAYYSHLNLKSHCLSVPYGTPSYILLSFTYFHFQGSIDHSSVVLDLFFILSFLWA